MCEFCENDVKFIFGTSDNQIDSEAHPLLPGFEKFGDMTKHTLWIPDEDKISTWYTDKEGNVL